MGKMDTSRVSNSILSFEYRRWKDTPLWGIILALFQVLVALILIPAIYKQFYSYLFSLGHHFYITLFTFRVFHILTFTTGNFTMFCIYKAKHPFFEQYRSEPTQPFPWEESAQKWNSILRKTFLQLAFNIVIFGPLLGIVMNTDKENVPFRYDIESWPSTWEIVWQVVFCSYCEDFMFYCTHRTLHTRWCYKYVHKRHHEDPIISSITAEYAHPIEVITGGTIPFYTGILILQKQCHFATLMVWVVYRIAESIDAHSGYEFPWSPFRLVPFSVPASFHNYHHTHNVGNYATFFCFWDYIFGTSPRYYAHREKLRQEKRVN